MNGTIKPNEIAFDIDDVVADFIPVFIEVLKEEAGVSLRLEDITDFKLSNVVDLPKKELMRILNRAINNPISLGMRMKPGARQVISKLLQYGPVYFVTARKNGKLIKQWLDKQLGFSSSNVIVVAMNGHDSKASALQRRNIRYFIDDRLETCMQIYNEGIESILFSHPHNAKVNIFYRVEDWKDIDDLIDWS